MIARYPAEPVFRQCQHHRSTHRHDHDITTVQVIDAPHRKKNIWDELFGLLNPEDRAKLKKIAVILAETILRKIIPV